MQLAAIGQPVSVCHQWSITGTRSARSHQAKVSGSARSPARKSVRRLPRSCCEGRFASGSSRLIARSAVGAAKSACTPCFSTTRQKADASGVPTGLPSYNKVVQPSNSGA